MQCAWPTMRPIATPRLVLEPQTAEHAGPMFEVLQDPAIYVHEHAPPASLAELRARFVRLETRTSGDGREAWLNWVVREPARGLIGYVQASIDARRRAAIAYVFASTHWGQGFAGEAVSAMIAELSDRWDVRLMRAVLKRSNERSSRLLRRLGFSLATSGDVFDDIPDDEVLMTRRMGNDGAP